MSDPKTIVRQGLERVELEPLTLTTFHARRERRRRNQRLAAGAVGGLIVLVMAILTVRALSDAPIDIGGRPKPAPAQAVEFRSPLYGYSLTHPGSWHANTATTAWTSGSLDAPYADRLLGPADVVMLDAGSIPIPEGMTDAEWLEREGRRAVRLGGGGGSSVFTYRPTTVDGEPAQLSEICNVVLVVKDRRGYVFRFHASLATNIDLRDVVRSIELHPEDAGN